MQPRQFHQQRAVTDGLVTHRNKIGTGTDDKAGTACRLTCRDYSEMMIPGAWHNK